jgi:hypothetical protein
MKYNNELTLLKEIHNIENAKSKYFLIGFMVSLIPYSLILMVASKLDASSMFIYTILAFTIITCIFNAFMLSHNIHNKLIQFFENKYECSYKQIKESIK